MNETYISVQNVDKFYGKFQALNKVNLDIARGRIVGLLGKNGAGKSTLMRCMLGFLKYSGKIAIMGRSVKKHQEQLHKHIAFIPDVNCLDDRLTIQQTIDYVSSLNESWNAEKAKKLLDNSKLPMKKKVATLSKGMKTKLYLLITLSLDVDILLLDEPTLGLDIVFRKEFFNTILGEFFNENKTIIISTHQVEEVEHILQEIIFIDEGEIILQEDVEKLKNEYTIYTLPSDRRSDLEKYKPNVINYTLGNVSALLKSEIEMPDAELNRPVLSDIFMEKVGGRDE